MKKMAFVAMGVAVCALGGARAGTLSFDVAAGETNNYTTAIGSDVTAITKTGGCTSRRERRRMRSQERSTSTKARSARTRRPTSASRRP